MLTFANVGQQLQNCYTNSCSRTTYTVAINIIKLAPGFSKNVCYN